MYYISFSEYDLNHEGMLFKEKSHAAEFASIQLEAIGAEETFEEYDDQGLISIKEAAVYEPAK